MPKVKPKEVIKISLHIYEGNRLEQLNSLYEEWKGCTRCPLGSTRKHEEIVFGDGNPESKVLIVGEAPGEEEENTGLPFVGQSGRLLNQILARTSNDSGIQELSQWYSK